MISARFHSLLFLPEQVPDPYDSDKASGPGPCRGLFFLPPGPIIRRMSSGYLWVKAFHIVFVAAWFAGLFYLPRLFVNLAMVPADSHAERERLLLMARKLYRFSNLLMVPAAGAGPVAVAGLRHRRRAGLAARQAGAGGGGAGLPPRLPAHAAALRARWTTRAAPLVPRLQRSLGAAVRGHRRAGRRQALLMRRGQRAAARARRRAGGGLRAADPVRQPVPLRGLALAAGPHAGRSAGAALARRTGRCSTSGRTGWATCRWGCWWRWPRAAGGGQRWPHSRWAWPCRRRCPMRPRSRSTSCPSATRRGWTGRSTAPARPPARCWRCRCTRLGWPQRAAQALRDRGFDPDAPGCAGAAGPVAGGAAVPVAGAAGPGPGVAAAARHAGRAAGGRALGRAAGTSAGGGAGRAAGAAAACWPRP